MIGFEVVALLLCQTGQAAGAGEAEVGLNDKNNSTGHYTTEAQKFVRNLCAKQTSAFVMLLVIVM